MNITVTITITMYIVIGLVMWLEVVTKNNISIKIRGHKEWRQVRFFKVVPLWPLFFVTIICPRKLKIEKWLYK